MLGITSALIEMMCQVIGQMGSMILSAKHDNARATRCFIVTPQKDWKAMLPAAMDFNEVGVYSPLNQDVLPPRSTQNSMAKQLWSSQWLFI